MKLKTLKDIEKKNLWMGDCGGDIIRREAIEWIKYLRSKEELLRVDNQEIVKCVVKIANGSYNFFTIKELVALHFEQFFNIIEEDLK